jgi:hypothetical protein
MDILKWNYLNSCTYFAKPYYLNEVVFENEFQESLFIWVNDNGQVTIECGTFSLKHNTWSVDYDLIITAPTFEECIEKLYLKVYKLCGEDYIMDYLICDDVDINKVFTKLENGNYSFNSDKFNSYWIEYALMSKIESFSGV